MKRPDRITAVFGALVLTCVVMVGAFSASAAGGDQQDPLITLSYLTQVLTPQLMETVDERITERETQLNEKIDEAIDDYSDQVSKKLAQSGATSTTFAAVSLNQGQTLKPAAGSEILLISGEAVVSAGDAPGLLDSTTGSNLEVDGALQASHLYVVAQDGATVQANAATQLLVRGVYAVV